MRLVLYNVCVKLLGLKCISSLSLSLSLSLKKLDRRHLGIGSTFADILQGDPMAKCNGQVDIGSQNLQNNQL